MPLDGWPPLYLPTYSPRLNATGMLWRHCRREVTHYELFESAQALLVDARLDLIRRHNRTPERMLSTIGAYPAVSVWLASR